MNFLLNDNCAVCKGTGICQTCNGSKKHPDNQNWNCPTCKGTGECVYCKEVQKKAVS